MHSKTRSLLVLVLALAGFAPASALAQDAPGRYANAVLAASTSDGQEVTLALGWHRSFPLPGVDWDSVLLRVGERSYRFSQVRDTGRVSVRPSQDGRTVWLSFAGALQSSGKAPPVRARIVVRANATSLPQPMLEAGRALDRRLPLPLLAVHRLLGGSGWVVLGERMHRLVPESLSGHCEETRGATLNPGPAAGPLLVYDYVAGVRPGDEDPLPVWTNGRLFLGAFSFPVSPGVPLSGLGPLPFTVETYAVDRLTLGPLVLERRLEGFRTVASRGAVVYRGLREVWRWDDSPGEAPRRVPSRSGMTEALELADGR